MSAPAPGSQATPASTDVESVPVPRIRLNSDGEPNDAESQSVILKATALAATPAAVSIFSSLTFHLAAWAVLLILLPMLGINWSELVNFDEPPLQASLGDEEVFDDMAKLDFAGEVELTPDSPSKQLEKIQTQIPVSDAGWLESSLDDVWQNVPGGDSATPDGEGSGLLLKVPKAGLAVTKGSFTAFTIPANPSPGQVYQIVIEVRLPDDVKKYKVSDLSGRVIGSDKFEMTLPRDTLNKGLYSRGVPPPGYPVEGGKLKEITNSSSISVTDNRVQIVVSVPGGARLVKDTIVIRSRRLKEEQELVLVFGKKPAADSDDDETDENEQDDDQKPEMKE